MSGAFDSIIKKITYSIFAVLLSLIALGNKSYAEETDRTENESEIISVNYNSANILSFSVFEPKPSAYSSLSSIALQVMNNSSNAVYLYSVSYDCYDEDNNFLGHTDDKIGNSVKTIYQHCYSILLPYLYVTDEKHSNGYCSEYTNINVTQYSYRILDRVVYVDLQNKTANSYPFNSGNKDIEYHKANILHIDLISKGYSNDDECFEATYNIENMAQSPIKTVNLSFLLYDINGNEASLVPNYHLHFERGFFKGQSRRVTVKAQSVTGNDIAIPVLSSYFYDYYKSDNGIYSYNVNCCEQTAFGIEVENDENTRTNFGSDNSLNIELPYTSLVETIYQLGGKADSSSFSFILPSNKIETFLGVPGDFCALTDPEIAVVCSDEDPSYVKEIKCSIRMKHDLDLDGILENVYNIQPEAKGISRGGMITDGKNAHRILHVNFYYGHSSVTLTQSETSQSVVQVELSNYNYSLYH